MADASLTRYAISLGARDDTTGWRAESYDSSTIEGSVQPRGATFNALPCGNVARYPQTLFTGDVVHEGDVIKDAFLKYYRVKTVDRWAHLDQFSHYQCELDEITNYPEESVTPPTPDEDDARYTTRYWIGDWLSLSCDWASMYAYPHYPMQLEFTGGSDEDVIFLVDHPNTTPLLTYDHYTYGFREEIPVTIAVLQKYSQTDTQEILWAAEDALRTVCRSHPLGSVRTLNVIRDTTQRMGSAIIAMRECTINYKRTSEYEPSYPTLTWGESGTPDGTYVFPNCTRIEYPNGMPDIKLLPPGRVGNVHQIMGDSSLMVRLYCDLDIEPSTNTWKRPQAALPKTDRIKHQILWEMKHGGGIIAGDEPYQVLTLSATGPTFKVRLVSFDAAETGDGQTLMAEFEEYVYADASGDTYKTRWGIS